MSNETNPQTRDDLTETLELDLAALWIQFDEANAEHTETIALLDAVKARAAHLGYNLAKAETEHANAQVAARAELDANRAEIGRLEIAVRKFEARAVRLRWDLGTAQKDLDELRLRVQPAETEQATETRFLEHLAQALADRDEARDERDQFKAELVNRSAVIAAGQTQLDERWKDVEAAIGSRDEARAQRDDARAEVEALQHELQALRNLHSAAGLSTPNELRERLRRRLHTTPPNELLDDPMERTR